MSQIFQMETSCNECYDPRSVTVDLGARFTSQQLRAFKGFCIYCLVACCAGSIWGFPPCFGKYAIGVRVRAYYS